jgi:hypothetical protein
MMKTLLLMALAVIAFLTGSTLTVSSAGLFIPEVQAGSPRCDQVSLSCPAYGVSWEMLFSHR